MVTSDFGRVAALIVLTPQEYEQGQEFGDSSVPVVPEEVTCPKPRTGYTPRTASPRRAADSAADA